MAEVVPGVFRFRTRHSANSYLITDGAGRAVLIDPGSYPGGPDLIRAVEGLGARVAGLAGILLTHAHPDHAGAAALIQDWSGAPVYAHPAEFPRLLRAGGPGRFRMPRPVRLVPLEDGEVVPGVEGLVAVHTPGHAPGHLVFFLPDPKLVFLGDLLLRTDGRLARPIGLFGRSAEAHLRSLKRTLALGAETAFFGHGDPVLGGFSGELDRFLANLRPEPEWLRIFRNLPELIRFGLQR
jgi:glyoxylase-like metal-dependent hydrolase (beta-lactamase superfamily II)